MRQKGRCRVVQGSDDVHPKVATTMRHASSQSCPSSSTRIRWSSTIARVGCVSLSSVRLLVSLDYVCDFGAKGTRSRGKCGRYRLGEDSRIAV